MPPTIVAPTLPSWLPFDFLLVPGAFVVLCFVRVEGANMQTSVALWKTEDPQLTLCPTPAWDENTWQMRNETGMTNSVVKSSHVKV